MLRQAALSLWITQAYEDWDVKENYEDHTSAQPVVAVCSRFIIAMMTKSAVNNVLEPISKIQVYILKVDLIRAIPISEGLTGFNWNFNKVVLKLYQTYRT